MLPSLWQARLSALLVPSLQGAHVWSNWQSLCYALFVLPYLVSYIATRTGFLREALAVLEL